MTNDGWKNDPKVIKAINEVQGWCSGHNAALPECPMMPSIRALCAAVAASCVTAIDAQSKDVMSEAYAAGLAFGQKLAASRGGDDTNKTMREALYAIAANTCCGGCREAARVARAALARGAEP